MKTSSFVLSFYVSNKSSIDFQDQSQVCVSDIFCLFLRIFKHQYNGFWADHLPTYACIPFFYNFESQKLYEGNKQRERQAILNAQNKTLFTQMPKEILTVLSSDFII